MRKNLLLLTAIIVIGCIGFLIGQNANGLVTKVLTESDVKLEKDILNLIKDEKIKFIETWEDQNGKKFTAIVRQLDNPTNKDFDFSTTQQLKIYDENDKSVYDYEDVTINKFEFATFFPDSTQFVLETNSGGTDEHLTILNLQDGKFTELDIEGSTQLRAGWWTMPEYRSDVKAAYFKPAQLILLQQIGGSDPNPKAAVFRNKNNKLKKVGEISMNELGDSIEKQLRKK